LNFDACACPTLLKAKAAAPRTMSARSMRLVMEAKCSIRTCLLDERRAVGAPEPD
jgi:hypothetical protein